MDAELKALVDKLSVTVMSKFLRSEDCLAARQKIKDQIVDRVFELYNEELIDYAAQKQEKNNVP